MTKLEELMKRPYKLELIEDPDEGGFVCGETGYLRNVG